MLLCLAQAEDRDLVRAYREAPNFILWEFAARSTRYSKQKSHHCQVRDSLKLAHSYPFHRLVGGSVSRQAALLSQLETFCFPKIVVRLRPSRAI